MENMSQKQFCLNYKHIVIDEIALSGLEGVGFDLLWRLVEKRISSPVTEKLRQRFWNYIVNSDDVSVYQLPEQLPHVEILDRFAIIDEETGQIIDPPNYVDGPYDYHPVENEYGSCKHYETRLLIPKDSLTSIPYEKVVAKYGGTMVMVASLEERWGALAHHMPITCLSQLSPVHYCILELVGRGRENGQLTVGKTNLVKILKDSKFLFYNRNFLQSLDLIRVQNVTQTIGNRGGKCLLLRLKRFHKPLILTKPSVGAIHNIVEYLLEQPDYSERTEVMVQKGIMSLKLVKKLQKTINIFSFEDRLVPNENRTSIKLKFKTQVKRKFISLTSPSDNESSQSDDEKSIEPLKCQYKVKVDLLRQAYERFQDAGLKGLTQVEMAEVLGIEFYTARTICRTFKNRNIVREFLEDKGKQRISRYIVVTDTGDMDIKYEMEKQKLLQFADDSKTIAEDPLSDAVQRPVTATVQDSLSDAEVPIKKRKLEKLDIQTVHENVVVDCQNIHKKVKVLGGMKTSKILSLLSSVKKPTLRQLRFANGILKVLQEKQAITGYQTLSTIVSKEINEPPMDTKAVKILVQKLVTDGHLKLMEMARPESTKLAPLVLICASHVKSTDPVIRAKYKELGTRAMNIKKILNRTGSFVTRAMTQHVYPKYMKIQKLHEILTKVVYFHDGEPETTDFPPGFSSLVQIIPEFTVEFALGNISNYAISEIPPAEVTDTMLTEKLRNTPNDVFQMFLRSSSLQNAIRMNLKILALFGLIQLVRETSYFNDNIIVSYVFYVNRHAKIIDTSGFWPRQNAHMQKLERSYYFETFQDVENFWIDIYNISVKTTINLESRPRKKLLPPLRKQNEVLTHDNGQIFGDGLGACGFDSIFYLEIPRLWSTFYTKEVNRQTSKIIKKPTIKMVKRELKKKPKKPSKRKKNVIAKPPVEAKPVPKRRKRDRNEPIVKWSKEEDNIIMLCKAAITIMSPVSQPGCLKLRNTVARDILSMADPNKTGTMCHKRSLVIESNSNLAYEKDCIINELRYRGNLLQKYDGLLKKIRIRLAGNMTKLMHEARIPMLELVWMMSQLMKSNSYKRRIPCVAMDFDDFHKNYTLCPSSANSHLNLYKTPPDCDIAVASIKEGILMTVMASYKAELPTDMATLVYTMFSVHSEQNLRTAIEQLRKSKAVAAREKILNFHLHRFHFQDMVRMSYKVAAAYQRKWICRLNDDFLERLTSCVHEELPQTSVKGCPGLNCLFCELHTCEVLDIVTVTVPVVTGSASILQEEQLSTSEMETKFSLKSGSCGWKNKSSLTTFSKLYTDIHVENNLITLARNSVVEPNEETQKLNTEKNIIAHLMNTQETGSTFLELQELTGYNSKTLTIRLTALESEHIIKRVGYYENLIVLNECTKPWTLNIGDQRVIPSPWLTFEGDMRREVFLKWTSVIMSRVFENPGSTISYLADVCEYLTTRSAQEVCMFLERCHCVTLSVMRVAEPDLFSNDDDIPELDDFSPYESVHNIYVFPLKDSLTKYACIVKKILDT